MRGATRRTGRGDPPAEDRTIEIRRPWRHTLAALAISALALGGVTAVAAPAAADEPVSNDVVAEETVEVESTEAEPAPEAPPAEATPVEEPAAPVEEPAAPVEEPAAPVEEPAALVEEPAEAPAEAPVEQPAEAPVEELAAEPDVVALIVPPGEEPVDKVEICHGTASYKNPYVINEPAADGDVQGHAGHTGPIFYPEIPKGTVWGDIIPPFYYLTQPGNVVEYFPGLNWTAEGQAIYENDCVMPEPPELPTMVVDATDCLDYIAPSLTVWLYGLQENLDYRVVVSNQDGLVDIWELPAGTSGDTSFTWYAIPGGDYTVVFEQAIIPGEWEEVDTESFTVVDCPVLGVTAEGLGCSLGDDGTALVSLSGLIPGASYEWLLRGDDFEASGVLDDEVTSESLDVPFGDLPPGNYFFYIRWEENGEIEDAQASFFVEPCPPEITVVVHECPAYGEDGGAVVKLSDLVEGLTYEVWIIDSDDVVHGTVKSVVADATHMAEIDVSPLPAGKHYTAYVYAPWEPPGGMSEWGDVDYVALTASVDFSLKPCPAKPHKPEKPATPAKVVKPTGLADTGTDGVDGMLAAALAMIGLGGAALIVRRIRIGSRTE